MIMPLSDVRVLGVFNLSQPICLFFELAHSLQPIGAKSSLDPEQELSRVKRIARSCPQIDPQSNQLADLPTKS